MSPNDLTYTFIFCEKTGEGSHWIGTADGKNKDRAQEEAMEQCMADWGTDAEPHVLCVMEGDIAITSYDDSVFQTLDRPSTQSVL